MSKLTKKQLQQRMEKLKTSARAEIAKTEVMHFRIDADSIEQLYECAGREKKPAGALIRQWILERLQSEGKNKQVPALSLREVSNRLQAVERRLKISTV